MKTQYMFYPLFCQLTELSINFLSFQVCKVIVI